MLVAASLSLVAAGAACLLALRRRNGPDEIGVASIPDLWIPPPVRAEAAWRSAEIEAELQEMIAEERAKAVVSTASETPSEVRELEPSGVH
jgi:hypothetical protein